MDNTNLLVSIKSDLVLRSRAGVIRETFFNHQLQSAGKQLRIPETGDFVAEEKYIFEIGGKGKKPGTVQQLKNAYIVKDDIEVGHKNIVPLWLFGFLY
jgi:hypothetical protein